MALDTVRQAVDRIAEHAREHRLRAVRIILHGGEPLLVGKAHLGALLTVIAERLSPRVEVRLSLQTNGTLVDEAFLAVLHDHDVAVAVSLDGTRTAHDRHRRYANGRPSHARVATALRLLNSPRHRELFAGLLCTVDLANDPVETYEALLAFAPPRLDFLLPHGTWEYPPPGLAHRRMPPVRAPVEAVPDEPAPSEPVMSNEPTPYGNWLIGAFDRWFDAPVRETGVRMFDEIISGLLGGPVHTEVLGLAPLDLVVVETDGTIENSDSLKVVGQGAPETGLDVFRHTFSEALTTPTVRHRQSGLAGLGQVCRDCALVTVCGGGLYTHRHHPTTGFATPSVYCHDLAVFITHVRRRVETALAHRADTPEERAPERHSSGLPRAGA